MFRITANEVQRVTGPILVLHLAGLAAAQPEPGFYALENIGERVFYIDPLTGRSRVIASTGLTGVNGIAHDATRGATYFTGFTTGQTSWTLYDLDVDSGLFSEVGSTGLSSLRGLAREGGGQLHTIAGGSGDVTTYPVDQDTGAAVAYGSTGSSPLAYDSAYDPITKRVWFSAAASRELYSLDPVTGEARFELDVNAGGSGVTALSFLPDGTMYGVSLSTGIDSLYRIDRDTGVGALIGSTGFDQVLSMTYIPSPGTLALIGAAGVLDQRLHDALAVTELGGCRSVGPMAPIVRGRGVAARAASVIQSLMPRV